MQASTKGCQECLQRQVAVDGEHELIVAVDVSSNASDQSEMVLLVDECKRPTGPA